MDCFTMRGSYCHPVVILAMVPVSLHIIYAKPMTPVMWWFMGRCHIACGRSPHLACTQLQTSAKACAIRVPSYQVP